MNQPNVVPPTIPALSWRGALSPLLVFPSALPLLVAFFAPEEVLVQWPSALHLTEWVQSMVPFLNMKSHANSTAFPQVALLAHSLTVLVVPTLALIWLVQTTLNYPQLLRRRLALGRMSVKQHLLALLIGPPLFLGGLYVFIGIPGDPSFALGVTTSSRAGLGLLSFLLAYLTGLVLGTQILSARLFIDTYLTGSKNDNAR